MGIGIARCICKTNAKLAIKTEERVLRKQDSVRLSLFLLSMSDNIALADSDIVRLRLTVIFYST